MKEDEHWAEMARRSEHHYAHDSQAKADRLQRELIDGALEHLRQQNLSMPSMKVEVTDEAGPPILVGNSYDPDDPTPMLIPRQIAREIAEKSPAMAIALGITDYAFETGRLHDVALQLSPGQMISMSRVARPSLNAAGALRLHAELRRAAAGEPMHKWMGVWLSNWSVSHDPGPIPASVVAVGREYCAILRESLKQAGTYLMAADATPLVHTIAAGLPFSIVPTEHLPPSRHGFLAFAAPYEIEDPQGRLMAIRAMSWLWAERQEEGEIGDGWPAGSRDGFIIQFWTSQDDEPLPDDPEERERHDFVQQHLGPLLLAQSIPLPIGSAVEDWPTFQRVLENGNDPMLPHLVLMALATWMLIKQPITSITHGGMATKERREIRKRGRIGGDVRVIEVRHRPASDRDYMPSEREPGQGGSGREYTHRWRVKAHPHWYRCGPNHPNAVEVAPGVFRCQVMVQSYVKGPADAPLLETPKVYRVSGRL